MLIRGGSFGNTNLTDACTSCRDEVTELQRMTSPQLVAALALDPLATSADEAAAQGGSTNTGQAGSAGSVCGGWFDGGSGWFGDAPAGTGSSITLAAAPRGTPWSSFANDSGGGDMGGEHSAAAAPLVSPGRRQPHQQPGSPAADGSSDKAGPGALPRLASEQAAAELAAVPPSGPAAADLDGRSWSGAGALRQQQDSAAAAQLETLQSHLHRLQPQQPLQPDQARMQLPLRPQPKQEPGPRRPAGPAEHPWHQPPQSPPRAQATALPPNSWLSPQRPSSAPEAAGGAALGSPGRGKSLAAAAWAVAAAIAAVAAPESPAQALPGRPNREISREPSGSPQVRQILLSFCKY